jgi:hypothetical protein
VNRFSLTHLSNEVLRRELTTKAAREKEATAELLAHIAEFDERKLYVPAAYESMFAYCVGELGLSEDAAKKRIQVARAGRACPGVFEALESGHVHLTGLRLLAPHLSRETAGVLLAAATHRTKEDIERFLAARAPRLDVPAMVAPTRAEGAPGHLGNTDSQGLAGGESAGGTVILGRGIGEGSPGTPRERARITPLSAEAYAVQFTRSRKADERFRYAQDLLGHSVKPDDIANVYERAVEALIERLERVRFGARAKPRKGGRRSKNGTRYVSRDVKRAVWTRDGGQCTYTSESGRRCEARKDLQYDHVTEFARGGEATVDNIRLRCPGHNQHAAEQTFGAGFMKQKREGAAAARAAVKAARARDLAGKAAEAERARLLPHQLEVIPWLEQLGCRKDESRVAVERCRDMADAPLEQRVKRSLTWFGARLGRKVLPAAAAASDPPSPADPPA